MKDHQGKVDGALAAGSLDWSIPSSFLTAPANTYESSWAGIGSGVNCQGASANGSQFWMSASDCDE